MGTPSSEFEAPLDEYGLPIVDFDIYDELHIGKIYQGWDIILDDKFNKTAKADNIQQIGFPEDMGTKEFLAAFQAKI